MEILIVHNGIIPAFKYGGTERVIWSLGKSLIKLGHKVTFLVADGSYCDFANIITINNHKAITEQIPDYIDVIHFNSEPSGNISKPYIVTMHGNRTDKYELNDNTVFVSNNHAERYGSTSYVHNGLDWNDYPNPDFTVKRDSFHFLGKAAWRVKNIKGAIDTICSTKKERLNVLGGNRLNIKMGFRLTFSPRVSFKGMIGGNDKFSYLNKSKGLIFPVIWHEPFGLAITESLYFGAPVFGTPYGSLPELVNSEIGFLSSNQSELTKAIEENVYNPKLCYEYANDIFNSDIMAKRYVEKYEIVIKGGKLNNQKPKLVNLETSKFLLWK